MYRFNPRTRVGCDKTTRTWRLMTLCFNPRTRVGCDKLLCAMCFIVMFQSTHPCGVRLDEIVNETLAVGVSIHAPVWGATRMPPNTTRALGFQSTHPCGVRRHTLDTAFCGYCFNPRTRVGCDASKPNPVLFYDVSIHAPVWGATRHSLTSHLTNVFQSTHPCGVRRLLCSKLFAVCLFQSTHPCGVRRCYTQLLNAL